jgi:hypothetical protein
MSNMLQAWLSHLQGIDALPTSPSEISVPGLNIQIPQSEQQNSNQMQIPGLDMTVPRPMTVPGLDIKVPKTAQIPADAIHQWLNGDSNGQSQPR